MYQRRGLSLKWEERLYLKGQLRGTRWKLSLTPWLTPLTLSSRWEARHSMVQVLRSCIYSPLKPGVPKPFSLGRPKLKLHWQAYKDLLYCLCSTVLMQNGTRVLIYRNWPCYSLHKKGLCRRTHRGPQWKEQKAQTYVKRGQIWKTQGIKSGNTGNTRAPGRHKEWGEKPQAQIHRNHQLTEHRKQEINQTNNPNPDRPREDVGPMRVSLAYFCRNSNVLTRWRPRLRRAPSRPRTLTCCFHFG